MWDVITYLCLNFNGRLTKLITIIALHETIVYR